jgi:hypothetical protein
MFLAVSQIVLLLNFTLAVGSECEPPGSASVELHRATAVFAGEVVTQEFRELKDEASRERLGEGALVTRFKVERWWKGGEAKEVEVFTTAAQEGAEIHTLPEDVRFRVGQKYLVYAFGPAEELRTRRCSRTRGLKDAGEDIPEPGADSAADEGAK